MGRHSDSPKPPPSPSSPDLALYKASFQHPSPPYANPNLPHGGPFRLRALPVELQEQIFDQVLLDENPDGWEYLGANADKARSGERCLSLCEMRPPVLAGVSKSLRADVLAHLFRTTTFRVDVSVDDERSTSRRTKPRFKVEQRRKTIQWLRSLDERREVVIRKLQVRLQTPDSLDKRANVLFSYGTDRARWEVEMKVDEGWKPDAAQVAQLVPRPAQGDLIVLQRLLERELVIGRIKKTEGMDWSCAWDVVARVADWMSSDHGPKTGFRYQDVKRLTFVNPEYAAYGWA